MALDQAVLEGFLVGLEEQDMGLDLVMDQVEAMVQDQGLDMEQVMAALDQNLLNMVKLERVLVEYLEVELDEVVMVQLDLKLLSMGNLVELYPGQGLALQ